jgi:hypothetical protein
MLAMSTSKKPTPREELERIEDALIDIILNASGADLRNELTEAGIDPDSMIAEVDATISAAKAECVRKRLRDARSAVEKWQKRNGVATTAAIDAARAKLNRMRSGDQELDRKMMLAARKGDGLSESDMNGVLEDLAALEELEREGKDE